VTIKLTNDTVSEPDRTIAVTLSSPTGGLVIGRGVGVASILDDDHP
jgi:hypothetical protein